MLCCLMMVFSACKKNNAPKQEQDQDQPLKREHGAVNGTAVTS